MDAEQIIACIQHADKKTPVKVFLNESAPIEFHNATVFGTQSKIVFGNWEDIEPVLLQHSDKIQDMVIENSCRNSAVPMLDLKSIDARIEPGALIREHVVIHPHAVIMMGAIINIGAEVGAGTMIDMGAVLGGRVIVGEYCHIGAGAVLAGVIEPPSAVPVIVEDHVVIGANAVVIEGVHIGKGAVVAAGSVVIHDVEENSMVAGIPARVIKIKDEQTASKTGLVAALRNL